MNCKTGRIGGYVHLSREKMEFAIDRFNLRGVDEANSARDTLVTAVVLSNVGRFGNS